MLDEDIDALRQIRAITVDYFDAIDRGDMVRLEEIFEHARVRGTDDRDGVSVRPRRDDPFDWRGQAVATYRGMLRFYDGVPCTNHFTTNLTIDLACDLRSAVSTSRFTVVQARPGFPLQPIAIGRYVDTFEPRQGRWRLVDRYEDCLVYGHLHEHLQEHALQGMVVASEPAKCDVPKRG